MNQLLHNAIAKGNDNYYTGSIRVRAEVCNTVLMKFRLAHYRKERGLTQTQVADAIGISQGLYNQLESGKRRMNETYLASLAELYSVEPTQLIVDPAKADPLYAELDEAFRRLSHAERKILVNSAKGIVAGREKT